MMLAARGLEIAALLVLAVAGYLLHPSLGLVGLACVLYLLAREAAKL